MADQAIVDKAVSAAPKNYTLAAGVVLALKAVRASYDGSGVAVPWYPALQLVAPDGTVMWTALPNTSLAAGVSADVSWFPGLGKGAQVPSGTPATPSILFDYTLPAAAPGINTATDGPYAGVLNTSFFLLEIWIYARSDQAAFVATTNWRLNGDGGNNYDRTLINDSGGVITITNEDGITSWRLASMPGASSPGSYFGVGRLSIPGYGSRQGWLGAEATYTHPGESAANTDKFVALQGLGWRSTAPVTQLQITMETAGAHLVAGSRLLIYGK